MAGFPTERYTGWAAFNGHCRYPRRVLFGNDSWNLEIFGFVYPKLLPRGERRLVEYP